MATASQVAEFRQANQSLVLLAQRDLRSFWEALDLYGQPAAVRNALLDFFPELLGAYGDAAALLGADWYDALRQAPPSAASFRAVLARPLNLAQAAQTIRWGLGPLFAADPDPEAAFARINGAAQRLVLQPGRDTVFTAAVKDPVNVRFARIPSGPTTCYWCTMLASRGFVYKSASHAGESNEWHDRCDCVITPGHGSRDFPDGFDVDTYRKAHAINAGIGRDLPT